MSFDRVEIILFTEYHTFLKDDRCRRNRLRVVFVIFDSIAKVRLSGFILNPISMNAHSFCHNLCRVDAFSG